MEKTMDITWRKKWEYGVKFFPNDLVLSYDDNLYLCFAGHKSTDYDCPSSGRNSKDYWIRIQKGFIFHCVNKGHSE